MASALTRRTGAHILAPCVGNRHGSYKPFKGGPESQWDLKLLKTLCDQFKGRIPICAHGTDELPDSLFVAIRDCGVTKVSFNSCLVTRSTVRDPQACSAGNAIQAPTPEPILTPVQRQLMVSRQGSRSLRRAMARDALPRCAGRGHRGIRKGVREVYEPLGQCWQGLSD
jgi:hypothetical protein